MKPQAFSGKLWQLFLSIPNVVHLYHLINILDFIDPFILKFLSFLLSGLPSTPRACVFPSSEHQPTLSNLGSIDWV